MTTLRRRTRSAEYTDQRITSENLDLGLDTMSSCRDRTSEFASAVRSLQSRKVSISTEFGFHRRLFLGNFMYFISQACLHSYSVNSMQTIY